MSCKLLKMGHNGSSHLFPPFLGRLILNHDGGVIFLEIPLYSLDETSGKNNWGSMESFNHFFNQ